MVLHGLLRGWPTAELGDLAGPPADPKLRSGSLALSLRSSLEPPELHGHKRLSMKLLQGSWIRTPCSKFQAEPLVSLSNTRIL